MGLEVGQQISYDLTESSSLFDRKKGQRLIEMGEEPVGWGTIHTFWDDQVIITTRSSTGHKRIPMEAIYGISI